MLLYTSSPLHFRNTHCTVFVFIKIFSHMKQFKSPQSTITFKYSLNINTWWMHTVIFWRKSTIFTFTFVSNTSVLLVKEYFQTEILLPPHIEVCNRHTVAIIICDSPIILTFSVFSSCRGSFYVFYFLCLSNRSSFCHLPYHVSSPESLLLSCFVVCIFAAAFIWFKFN